MYLIYVADSGVFRGFNVRLIHVSLPEDPPGFLIFVSWEDVHSLPIVATLHGAATHFGVFITADLKLKSWIFLRLSRFRTSESEEVGLLSSVQNHNNKHFSFAWKNTESGIEKAGNLK